MKSKQRLKTEIKKSDRLFPKKRKFKKKQKILLKRNLKRRMKRRRIKFIKVFCRFLTQAKFRFSKAITVRSPFQRCYARHIFTVPSGFSTLGPVQISFQPTFCTPPGRSSFINAACWKSEVHRKSGYRCIENLLSIFGCVISKLVLFLTYWKRC